jgi:hypothetical protein
MYVIIHDLLSEFYQLRTQYLAIPKLNSLLPGCLVILGEAVYLGTHSSKVLSSMLVSRPPSGCSETKQPLQRQGAESLAAVLPDKRTRLLRPSKPAFSETHLDSQLPSRQTTPSEAGLAFLGGRPHPPAVQHHLVYNRSESPC